MKRKGEGGRKRVRSLGVFVVCVSSSLGCRRRLLGVVFLELSFAGLFLGCLLDASGGGGGGLLGVVNVGVFSANFSVSDLCELS